MIKIKICGITNAEDARIAVAAGADALGFVMYRKSPRHVEPSVVRDVVAELPPFVLAVGVFVNEDLAVTRNLMDECGFALAQLHGDESASYCADLGRPVLKALRLKDREGLLALAEMRGRGNLRGILLDAYVPDGYGGTGRLADWSLAQEVSRVTPIVLAGGLTPSNVAEAIQVVRPYGVDVSSGVEERPGKKDVDKVRAFIKSVRLVS